MAESAFEKSKLKYILRLLNSLNNMLNIDFPEGFLTYSFTQTTLEVFNYKRSFASQLCIIKTL